MTVATCKHCGSAFSRAPSSTAANCSAKCRREASDARTHGALRKNALDLPGPTDDFDITFRAMIWPPAR